MRWPARGIWAGGAIVVLLLALGLVVSWFAPADPTQWQTVPRNRLPSLLHPLGTTGLGQDTFWLLTWAICDSLLLGLAVALFATAIGVAIGLAAGYAGGWVDRGLSFLTDSVICLPSLLVLILLASLSKGQASLPEIAVILTLFSWPFPARQARAVMLSMRERDFIHLAWFSGETPAAILWRQVFPYLRAWATASFVNQVLAAIAVETSLAVIGLSSAQQATLGTMIYWAIKYQALLGERWWWIGPPVVCIVALFIGLFLLSSGIERRRAVRQGVFA
jgi:peptide/nickel transport system permease protein